MYCRSPYIKDGFPFPCGQCFPCKMTKKRTWAHRIMLEAALWQDNALVTLTYNDDHMPRLEDGRGTLVYEDAQLFLKRLRRSYEPLRFRFFCVGEYGSGGFGERPHFHIILFNYKPCAFYLRRHRVGPDVICCPQCNLIYKTWNKGFITNETFGIEGAEYVAQYTIKKMTREDDIRLKGRRPEFARMSLKPGIGRDAMWDLASVLLSTPGALKDGEDVPTSLRINGKKWPLGKYLRKHLREYVGRDPETPDFVMDAIMDELRPLQEEAERRLKEAKIQLPASYDSKRYAQIYKEVILEQKAQLVASSEARFRIFSHGGTL